MAVALKERVVVITGGSSGFGLEMTRQLVDAGARVGLIARRSEVLQELCSELGEQVFAAPADICDSAQAEAAVRSIAEHFGGLDVLVNNAGMARPGFAQTWRDAEIQGQLQLNIAATLFCSRAALPFLKRSSNARVVNVSSASAEHHDEMAGLSIYAASKAALERLSRDLRRELAPSGIGVSILRPGAAMTDFAKDWEFERLQSAVRHWHRQGGWMDTGMTAQQVAEALLFCLSMPPGVSVDLLEIRPCTPVEKISF